MIKNVQMTQKDNFKVILAPYFILAILGWSVIIAISLLLNIANEKDQSIQLATNAAIANYNKDLSFRLWGSKHGGVYVPPTKETPPSPYLKHLKDRDVVTTSGKKLTLMNPAYMITQMMRDYKKLYGITGRLVGQVTLNPHNLADEFESKAIDNFIAGTKQEVIEKTQYEGEEQLRLIRPFMMEKSCLKCHGHLGFKVGEVRGAVSISIPLAPYVEIGKKTIQLLIISHCVIYLLGLFSIFFIAYRAYLNLKQRKLSSDQLQELNLSLDFKVKQRTSELSDFKVLFENSPVGST
jgi:hypothetical protein